jgi:GNAT superfamily N-acetyltransferase
VNLVVEPATVKDVSTILDFIRRLAEYERLSHEVIATEASLTKSLFGSRPEAEALIARLDGKAVGFALFFHNYSTFLAKKGLYLEDLFVLPESRGQGVGKAMLAALARIAVERDCGRLEWSVLDWNETAIRFYESLGSVRMTDWTVCRLTGEALQSLADS